MYGITASRLVSWDAVKHFPHADLQQTTLEIKYVEQRNWDTSTVEYFRNRDPFLIFLANQRTREGRVNWSPHLSLFLLNQTICCGYSKESSH